MEPTELEQIRCSTLLIDFIHGRNLDTDDKDFLHRMNKDYPEYYYALHVRLRNV